MSKKLTQAQFMSRVSQLHPKLDFSQSVYINSAQKVVVVCDKHGGFLIKPDKLFVGQGCAKCSRRMTPEEFIVKIQVFNSRNYDLSCVVYNGLYDPISLICHIHGKFELIPYNILSNKNLNCPECSRKDKALTLEEFIKRSRNLHGGKFDYSLVDYINLETKVLIKCNEGHIFSQSPDGHLRSQGCPKCSGHGKYSQQDFLFKAKLTHGDKYDLSKTVYIDSHLPITVLCPKHGQFSIAACVFLRGSGCRKCAVEKQTKTLPEFISELKAIHGDKYGLDKIIYKSSHVKIIVTCRRHGDFLISPNKLLAGQGCANCFERYTTQEYIQAVEKKYGKTFDYSSVEYKGCDEEIIIKCFNGHTFTRRAGQHLLKGSGCKECLGIKKKTTDQFIREAQEVHGNCFDYSRVKYYGLKTQVEVICPKHGGFWIIPLNHISRSQGCPTCRMPKGEKLIIDYLNLRGLPYVHNATFGGCRSILPLRFDFYIPEFKTCIEFDGEGHFEPIWGEESFIRTVKHDKIKTQFCYDNLINLVRLVCRNKDNVYKTLDSAFFDYII